MSGHISDVRHSRVILVLLETSHGNDKALPEAQAPLTESMNVGKTVKESCDTESAMQVRHMMEAGQ